MNTVRAAIGARAHGISNRENRYIALKFFSITDGSKINLTQTIGIAIRYGDFIGRSI